MSRLFAGISAIVLAIVAVCAHAEETPLSELRGAGAVVEDNGGEVLIGIDMTRAVGWRLRLADGPPRVVIELKDFDWTEAPDLKSSSILALELVRTSANTTELHCFLREPLDVVSAEMRVSEGSTAFLDVRLGPTTADAFSASLEAANDAEVQENGRLVVAIDPGHGGTDPGAEARGWREADIVMAFANRLRDILVASGRFDAVLTRNDDSLISLDERLSRARAEGADVLLSLHADSLEDADAASGIVVYRLATTAESAANERLTTRHAPDDQLTGVDLNGVGDDVSLALLDLTRRKNAARALSLSTALVDAFQSSELAVNSRPERQGNFAVLKAADIPSLLIELGFLSTDEDLQRLTSKEWQALAAHAIRDGLLLWASEQALQK